MAIHSSDINIRLNESGYGATQSALVLLWSDKSKRELERYCRENAFVRTSNDSPGQVYARSLTVLRYVKGDSKIWQAVCIASSHWDV